MAITVYKEDEPTKIDNPGEFIKDFKVIKAAGGAVTDDEGRVLLIFRRGKWDLPKGKLEDDEPVELCADREIKEETGIKELLLRKPLITTYHTYTEKGKSILKETQWFLFDAVGRQELKPQTDEDIMEALWVSPDKLQEYTSNSYQLIRDVLASAGLQ